MEKKTSDVEYVEREKEMSCNICKRYQPHYSFRQTFQCVVCNEEWKYNKEERRWKILKICGKDTKKK